MLPPDNFEQQPAARATRIGERAVALLEVVACSDYPTQFFVAAVLASFGYGPFGADGALRFGYIVALSLVDAGLLVGLIVALLIAHGQRPRDVLFGGRPVGAEAAVGLPMTFVALGLGVLVILPLRHFAPWLHTVPHNPLEAMMRSPRQALVFAGVVIVAGGVREEVQRAFILNRFERWLGGGAIGIVLASAAFGAGHLLQGADAAIATGVLGAYWGIVYLRRRSIVAPMVSHAGFDLLQIVEGAAAALLGP
jgi:membrane protease YdiL (CAAX protease family)